MATQQITYLTGRVGNLIMYQLGNTYVARSRPLKVTKTANMKTCSSNFGIASKAGKYIRQGLAAILRNPTDTGMQRQFSGCINKWLGKQPLSGLQPQLSIPVLEAFNFNNSTSFYERFKPRLPINILASGIVEINIPAFVPALQIGAPAHTVSVELCLAATAYQLATAAPADTCIFKKRIPFNATLQPAETVELLMQPLSQKLVLVVATLTYFFADGTKEYRQAFMPASVIMAGYP